MYIGCNKILENEIMKEIRRKEKEEKYGDLEFKRS